MSLKNKKSLLIKSLVVLIVFILTTLTYGSSELYVTRDFALEFDSKYKYANPGTVLGKNIAADRDFTENNLWCISGTEADGTGAGPYNAKHTVYGVIDINYDGPNTATLYRWRNGSTSSTKLTKDSNATDIAWFNGMAMAVTNHNSGAFTGIMMDHLYNYFYSLLGYSPIPSASWTPQGLAPYEEHGKDVLENALDGTFSVSKDFDPADTNCEYAVADSENVYVGPFKYSYKTKVNFGSMEITGKNDKQTVYNETVKSVDKTRLFVKDGSQYKGVDYVNPETPFYVKVSKKIDDATNISLNVKAKDVTYYKARIAILRSTGDVATQNLVVVGGDGEPNQTGAPIEYQFENNKGNLEIHKTGIYTDTDVNKIENMGFRIYYLENGNKQYLKIQTDTKSVDGKLIGTVKINKQEVTTKAEEATIIYTDQSGDARLERIDSRYEYYLEEVSDLTDYNTEILSVTQKLAGKNAKTSDVQLVEKGIAGPITVKKRSESEVTTVEVKDTRKIGALHLVKLDYDKLEKRVSGVKFKVQNTETQKWLIAEGSEGVYNLKTYDNNYKQNKEYYKENYTSEENKATEFETNSNGELTINGVDVGTYMFKEIYITNNNGKINYGYTEIDKPENVDKNYVFWSTDNDGTKNSLSDGEINVKLEAYEKADQSTVYVYNKKKYLKITGFVWEDIADGKANSYEMYGKDTYAEGDTLIDGINVRLKDKKGNIIKIATTENGGKYVFEEVSRETLENGEYYVEFEYNGLTYTSVVPLVGDDSKVNSKAGEVVEQRKKLNSAFTEITNKDNINNRSEGYSRDGSGNVTGTLTYKNDTANWQSIFENTTYDNQTYEGVNLTANTDVAGYSLKDEFTSGRYVVDDSDAFVIESVNLGMVKRSKPYIAISNDIENVIVDVNGYSHTYNYKQRSGAVQDGSAFNVGVKFGREYVSGYTRAIYPSDVAYSSTEAGKQDAKKLKVYVTYATTIRNLSSELKATVNELVNYYDKEYTIVNSWIGDDNNNKATWNLTSKYGQNYNDNNFVGAYTTSIAGTKINPMENLIVHITFQVSDKAVLGLLSETATLENTSEIYSYSSYYGSNKEGCTTDEIYAGIDEVSAPGNAKPGDKLTFEADTDAAPSLLLEAKGVRTIEGKVFEDKTESELQSAKERKGDGIYNDNENTVGGVKVELITTNGDVATIFPTITDENGNLVVNAKGQEIPAIVETTEKDGYYIFRGIEPEKYYIRYTYTNGITKIFDKSGNEVKDINVQDYKSTIITSDTIRKAFEDNENNLTWYKETGTRYSDARDDYEQRQRIDNELKTVDGATVVNIKELNAYSPKLELGVEYETIYTASAGDTYEYKVSDIDFGIAERPRQAVTLNKDITNIKVELYNGQSFGGDIDINNKKAPDGMFITPEGIYITIDNEFIPGTHLAISYALSLTNISELDYLSEDYYYYGEVKGDAVTFSRATLLDYIDNQLLLKEGQSQWSVIGSAEKFVNDKGFNWNLTQEQEKQLLEKFSTIAKTDPVSTSNQLTPGQTITTPIVLEKIIDAKDTELSYGNNCEVTKIEKNGGRNFDYKLGNYANILIGDTSISPEEADEDKAPKVTIIPPTGENNNVTYTIIAIASLAILGAGIFGIRRFLNK